MIGIGTVSTSIQDRGSNLTLLTNGKKSSWWQPSTAQWRPTEKRSTSSSAISRKFDLKGAERRVKWAKRFVCTHCKQLNLSTVISAAHGVLTEGNATQDLPQGPSHVVL